MNLPIAKRKLSGWGHYPKAICSCVRPERYRDLQQLTQLAHPLLARGNGRSYGDVSFTSRGTTVLMERFDRILDWDASSGRVIAEAGITFADLIRIFLPQGWFPAVTPGHAFVTMGGAVAANVHGKNHYDQGSFIDTVDSLHLVKANGQLHQTSRDRDPERFYACFGGLGLTGIIRDVTLRLHAVETGYLQTERRRTKNLTETFAELEQASQSWPYAVAWLDGLAPGPKRGRGIVDMARHACLSELPKPLQTHRWALPYPQAQTVPPLPLNAIRRPLMRQYNRLKWYRSPPTTEIKDWHQFFYPLDALGKWYRLYGPAGFIQYQFSVSGNLGLALIEKIMDALAQGDCLPTLMVLKRLRKPAQPTSSLDFLQDGWTVALDFPYSRNLLTILDTCDHWVVEAGGRIYLAKDSRWQGQLPVGESGFGSNGSDRWRLN
ncbi:MAG: FAD-binding oxidoreductase [Cyanothece sp. SIO1E1]|nr:FAD-binding oxidoreductase [Cyanothece sp. SIO1E1]